MHTQPPPRLGLETPPCNLCGSESFETLREDLRDCLLGTGGRWAIVRCRDCGLVQTRPRPDRASIAAFYPEVYEASIGADRARRQGSAKALLTAMRDLPFRLRYGRQRAQKPTARASRLLEIGCAGGRDLARYAAAGWNTWAVEPSPALAEVAARRAGIPTERIVVAPAEDAEFAPNSFDLIVMFHVIEHLHDPHAVVLAARRWLRGGGTLQIGCPNFGSLERRAFGRFWAGLDVPRHLYHFTPDTLSALLVRSGFRVSSIVPEQEYVFTSLSLSAAIHALRGAPGAMVHSRSSYALAMPFSIVSRALGAKPCMLVTATAR